MDFKTLSVLPDSTAVSLWKANVLGRISTANLEQTIHGDITYTGKRFAALTSISYSKFEDLRMGSRGFDEYQRNTYAARIDGKDTVLINSDPNVQVGTGYSQINLMQKFGFQGKNGWLYTFSSMYSESSDIPRYDRLIETKGDAFNSAEWNYGPQIWWMNQFVALGKLNSLFANEMKIVCDKIGIDYDKVVEYSAYDERLGKSHWAVPGPDGELGFGGHCLPKDISAIVNGYGDMELLQAVLKVNDRVRKNRDWEEMKGRAVV